MLAVFCAKLLIEPAAFSATVLHAAVAEQQRYSQMYFVPQGLGHLSVLPQGLGHLFVLPQGLSRLYFGPQGLGHRT